MDLATTVTVAGAAAAAAYLDAKYHVRKDVTGLYNVKKAERDFAKALQKERQSLWYIFEDVVNRMPASEECMWAREGVYTWRETHAMACSYAQYFLSEGVQPKQLVAFYLTNSLEFMHAWLGTWAMGTAPAMINYNLGGEGLIHCLKVSGAKLMLVDEDSECQARVAEVRARIEGELGMKIVVLEKGMREKISEFPPTNPPHEMRKDLVAQDPMCLFYTSGTTGFPKAAAFHIARTWGGTHDRIRGIGLEPGPNGDRWYDCMPMYHGTGGNVGAMCMLSGLTLCIGKKFSTSKFWDDIRDSRATAFVYVGETARYLLAAPPSPRDKENNVRVMFGNGLRPDVWNRFKERFGVETVSEFFNSTEGVFSLLNVARGDFLSSCVGHHGALFRLLLSRTFIPVAVEESDNSIARDPKTGFAIRKPYEEGGEIIVAVPDTSAFIGYYKNPEATMKRFERNVFKQGDLFYRSGDALRRDREGRWHFLDRLGDTFRWKSENVSTAEVAIALGNFPGIAEANVYGVLVPGHEGRAGCAAVFVAPGERATFDWAGLLAYLRKTLPRYAVPVFLRVVHELAPTMHNNKQSKVMLREEGVDLKKIKTGKGGPDDQMLWCPPGGTAYVEFKQSDYDTLGGGKVKL